MLEEERNTSIPKTKRKREDLRRKAEEYYTDVLPGLIEQQSKVRNLGGAR